MLRVDYAPGGRGTPPCAACRAALPAQALRVGVAPIASRRGVHGFAAAEYYHLDCVPAPYWREMRAFGIINLRGVSHADQAHLITRRNAAA